MKKTSRVARRRELEAPRVFHKTIMPGGLKILTETQPFSRAVCCGVWINSGTRDEREDESGMAHFVEHLVFKRTKNRSAYEISRDMEAVGGDLNAYTSRETTCFVSHSLRQHVGLSLEVLADLTRHPRFERSDIDKERQVVLQEIRMAEDQLEEAVFDHFFEIAFAGSPLAKPILGTSKSIQELSRSKIRDFHGRHYVDANMVVCVAGDVSHDEVVGLVIKHFRPLMSEMRVSAPGAPGAPQEKVSHSGARAKIKPVAEVGGWLGVREVVRRPSEQVHALLGLPALSSAAPNRYEGIIVNGVIGGGMTSLLYQKIREEKGLVYSIHSQLASFRERGVLLIYAATEPKKIPVVLELVMRELRKLRRSGVSRSQLNLFKQQIVGQVLLGADDVENRMNSLGVNELVFGKYRPIESVIADLEAITLDSVNEYVKTFVQAEETSMLLMGPLPEGPTKNWIKQL